MEFKLPRKGYADRQIYKHGTIDIKSGITILIGCNGSGKTTMLNEIKGQADKLKIPTYMYNNLNSSDNSMSSALYNDNYDLMAQLFCASEGESITIRLANKAEEIGYLLKYGERKKSKLEEAFLSLYDDRIKEKDLSNKERILLFDAIDSGLSIDQVRDLKEYFFTGILESYDNDNLYIIISANEYELCKDYPCFNVTDGKYVTLNSYEDYTKEILKTRSYKDTQIAKLTTI